MTITKEYEIVKYEAPFEIFGRHQHYQRYSANSYIGLESEHYLESLS